MKTPVRVFLARILKHRSIASKLWTGWCRSTGPILWTDTHLPLSRVPVLLLQPVAGHAAAGSAASPPPHAVPQRRSSPCVAAGPSTPVPPSPTLVGRSPPCSTPSHGHHPTHRSRPYLAGATKPDHRSSREAAAQPGSSPPTAMPLSPLLLPPRSASVTDSRRNQASTDCEEAGAPATPAGPPSSATPQAKSPMAAPPFPLCRCLPSPPSSQAEAPPNRPHRAGRAAFPSLLLHRQATAAAPKPPTERPRNHGRTSAPPASPKSPPCLLPLLLPSPPAVLSSPSLSSPPPAMKNAGRILIVVLSFLCVGCSPPRRMAALLRCRAAYPPLRRITLTAAAILPSPCKPRPDLGRPSNQEPIQPSKRSDGQDL